MYWLPLMSLGWSLVDINRGVENNNEYNASIWWNVLLFALKFSENNICNMLCYRYR